MARKNEDLIRLLNMALRAEYGAMFLLPQHIAIVQDEETKRQLRLIADVELEHAEKTAKMLYALGAEPAMDMPSLRPSMKLRDILETHIKGEKAAITIYTEAAACCDDPIMRKELDQLRVDEEGHQRLLERLMNRLDTP